MIYASTGHASEINKAKFYCPSMGNGCRVAEKGLYKGLIDNGTKVVWHTECGNDGCPGLLVMDNLDKNLPFKDLIKGILVNASELEGGTTLLWKVVNEFLAGSLDMMKVRNIGILSEEKADQPFKFMGYLAKHWLPLLAPTKVSAGVVSELVVEQAEQGILLNYHNIRIGIFEKISTAEFYTVAFYIEQEIRRQSNKIDAAQEDCDAINISVSGLIEYLDRMLFDIGSPLEEVHTIVRVLTINYQGDEQKDKTKEMVLRKAVGILWLLKDGCCEYQEAKIEKMKPKSLMDFQ